VRLLSGRRPAVLFVANGMTPTLEFSFLRPLRALSQAGAIDLRLLFEREVITRIGEGSLAGHVGRDVDLVVFSRYNGPRADDLLAIARAAGAATIYQLDDDLLDVPPSIGAEKHAFHSHPERRASVVALMEGCDVVHFSNERLAAKMAAKARLRRADVAGVINGLSPMRLPARGPTRRIGYMGFDHAADFAIAAPAVEKILRRHPQVSFEIFGPIPLPWSFSRFGERVRAQGPVRGYDAFLKRLCDLDWDVGICPLVTDAFNLVKTDVKWIEYSAAGIATVASRSTVYDACCADGCGFLPSGESEWFEALDRLVRQPGERYAAVMRAQRRLVERYSPQRLTRQVLDLFALAAPGRFARLQRKAPPLPQPAIASSAR